MLSLDVFLGCVGYGLIHRLSYLWMVFGCIGGGAFRYVPLELINEKYALSICWLLQTTTDDLVLDFFTIVRLTEVDWRAMENKVGFPYSYDEGTFMVLPTEPPLVRHSASSAEVREGRRL